MLMDLHVFLFQGSSFLLNVSGGSMSLTIPDSSLAPSQRYQVKVRSLLVPDSVYKGIPSEWTQPVDWTSHEGTIRRVQNAHK